MSKNKIIAICLFSFQALALISFAVIGTIGIALLGFFFCSFGTTAGLLLCLDTKEDNRPIASGAILVLFGLLLIIGSIIAMVEEFNGWHIVFIVGALAMIGVGAWTLFQRYQTESNNDKESEENRKRAIEFMEEKEGKNTALEDDDIDKEALKAEGETENVKKTLGSSAFFLASFLCVIFVLGSIAGMVFSAVPDFHVFPFVLCLLLFIASIAIPIYYYYKTCTTEEDDEES